MFEFSLTCQVVFGENTVEKLPFLLKERMNGIRMEKVMLITSKIMDWNKPMIEMIRSNLADSRFETVIFDGVQSNPTLGNIEEGKSRYLDTDCDAVIALGGGSPIDAAKIIAHECNASVFIVVPTTAGTGSEVSAWSVISDDKKRLKLSLCTRTPDIAILDPVLTATMPPMLTLITAVDAFSHALESYISQSANCFSDGLAYKSIQMTALNLTPAVINGNDITARTGLLGASLLSGIAMMSAGLGVGHALGNTIGGIYHDSSHGWLIAQLLEKVWEFNKKACPSKATEIDPAVQDIFLQVSKLTQKLNLTQDCLRIQDIDVIIGNSMKNVNIKTNPRSISNDELRELLTSCFEYI